MLRVIGFGSGAFSSLTFEAKTALDEADLIVGYCTYIQIISAYFPEKSFYTTGMGQELDRVRYALEHAGSKNIALVCSGDAELYGLAGLTYECAKDYPNVIIEVIPGVTAAFSGGAILGSPLTNDFAIISLSDYLTSFNKIQKRLIAASEADFVIVLYNPSSKHRKDYLNKACELILKYRSAETICGYVQNIGRNGQKSGILPLSKMKDFEADMFTTVYIGNSDTIELNGKMITPRGYANV